VPIVVIALLVPLALLSVFPSPYVYSPTQHVTSAEVDGYGNTFQYADDDLVLADLREYHTRYYDGIYGVNESGNPTRTIEDESLSDLDSQFEGSGYLIVIHADPEREIIAYRELRFSAEGFDSLDSQRGVDRVLSNRDVTLYHLEAEERSSG